MSQENTEKNWKRKPLHSENFYQGIDPAIVKIVCRTASSVIGKQGLKDQDLPDIEQEVMLAVFKGLPQHDTERSHSLHFIKLLAETAVRRILRKRRGNSGRISRSMVSLNQEIDLEGEEIQLQELVNDGGEFQETNTRAVMARYDEMLKKMDAVETWNECPEDLKQLAHQLLDGNVNQVAADLNIPAYLVYRMLQRFRKEMKKHEIFNFLRE